MMQTSFLGLSLPWLLPLAAGALVLSRLSRRLLARTGVYRWVWHPALFDLALDVLLLYALVQLGQALTS
ncbi:MAG TPA: DUF1656 domain-containing protein [Pseudorhodoferax sp.]|nr:DUF1656 domain-containing protein [Pseudorhodoferax sp.]